MYIFSEWGSLGTHKHTLYFLGFIYVLLGILALSFVGIATIFSVTFLGILIFASGLGEMFIAFQTKNTDHNWYHFFLGVLAAIVGVFFFANPISNAVGLTLLLAAFFFISGVVKLARGLFQKTPHQGWLAFNGLISILLGTYIVWYWPVSSAWLIGTLVGIELIISGAMMIGAGSSEVSV
jgi:uncharacterized membrane protein HdeD (DUF308 family)